ncbi:E3 ubiquitin-protein ligase PPP1R11 isoform X1 [Pan paniscus]|uniref:E3 ubiquitin-protein ligase PPP1R11 isoform X1 n=1 Tax=Pan paniscus TaxID=9597 RepID=UPI0015610CC8|nr:E3 ubiquitin-protein ligase PPP1R11 isoform X1 [Pan paniscus]
MNTWAAAHQNAAVFMRNLGPLARAPRKVMRRKKRAVVIHTVMGRNKHGCELWASFPGASFPISPLLRLVHDCFLSSEPLPSLLPPQSHSLSLSATPSLSTFPSASQKNICPFLPPSHRPNTHPEPSG